LGRGRVRHGLALERRDLVSGHRHPSYRLFGVAARTASDAWAVGSNGALAHWNGSA
jgi:hypothetical protein